MGRIKNLQINNELDTIEYVGPVQEPNYDVDIHEILEIVESECNECDLKIQSLLEQKAKIEKELEEAKARKDNLILIQDDDSELYDYYEEYCHGIK